MEHNQVLFADGYESLGLLVGWLDLIPVSELTAKWFKALAEQACGMGRGGMRSCPSCMDECC